jgi:hypothetical protein
MVEEYLQEKIRRDVIKEISNLEFPNEWNPQQVIDYIIRKIERQ